MIRAAIVAASLFFTSVLAASQDNTTQAAKPVIPTAPLGCHYTSGSTVTYNGQTSEGLAECLDGAPEKFIHTLNITSEGGDAAKTLALARRYQGRIGHVVVQGWCASSCANYILPIAAEVTVPDNAYVVVHGSYSAQAILDIQGKLKEKFHREHPNNTYSFSPTPDEARAIETDQNAFEQQWLSCPEWLHPTRLTPSQLKLGFPATNYTIREIFVSPTMARRCLKQAKILTYWTPPQNKKAEKKLRANKAVLLP